MQQIYTWKQNRFSISTTEQHKLNNALGRLALRDIKEGGSRFRLLESFIRKELGDPDDEKSSFYKALQLGWLNHVGIAAESQSKEKVYAFFHATFEEYFAALAIDDRDFFLAREHKNKPVKDKNTGKSKPYRIFEPEWKEVILLWLGREDVETEQKEEFIKALVEFQDGCGGFYKYQAYFLAAAGIAEFGECSRADEVVAQIVQWGFGYFNTREKQWETFVDPIKKRAKTALQQTHRAKAITALAKLIPDLEYEYTRWQAAESLDVIDPGNERAIDALENLIATSQDEYTRREAAQSLGEIAVGNERAIDALENLIATSQDEYTRREAAQSLDQIDPGNKSAIDALINLITTSQNESTRGLAAQSLEKIAVDNKSAIDALENLIATSQHEDTRRRAADSLGKIAVGNERAIAALVKLIVTSQSQDTRRRAADSLENILATDLMAKVVRTLKYRLNEEPYKIIWYCAQNMSYPDFYQAWHHSFDIKSKIRFARSRYRWWQIPLYLFLELSIFAIVRFIVSHNVNNPANIQRQQQIR